MAVVLFCSLCFVFLFFGGGSLGVSFFVFGGYLKCATQSSIVGSCSMPRNPSETRLRKHENLKMAREQACKKQATWDYAHSTQTLHTRNRLRASRARASGRR